MIKFLNFDLFKNFNQLIFKYLDSPLSNLDYSTRKFINTNRLINEIANQISYTNTEKFDTLYNKILLNHKYSNVNNVDLMNNMRSRFLL